MFLLKGGKTKILCPIYYEEARPPTAGVPESVIEKEMVRERGGGMAGEGGEGGERGEGREGREGKEEGGGGGGGREGRGEGERREWREKGEREGWILRPQVEYLTVLYIVDDCNIIYDIIMMSIM